jgi:diguanylate cyclase (GGDEF)-like protein
MRGAAELSRINRPLWVAIGLLLTAVIGLVDYLTGYEIVFSLFYLLPVSLVTWFTGRSLGLIVSVCGGITLLFADVAAGHIYSHPAVYLWNSVAGLASFVIVTLLLSALRRTLEHERASARTDDLTGAVNRRFFLELLGMELSRARRYEHPLVLAYIDLDDFKSVNDRWGHGTGDQVLRAMVKQIRTHLRHTDVVARLGGDEFAILLPETGVEAGRGVVSKIREDAFAEIAKQGASVTLSIGVLTCLGTTRSVDEVLGLADRLMYAAKNAGKNAVEYATLSDPATGS